MREYIDQALELTPKNDFTKLSAYSIQPMSDLRYYKGRLQQKVLVVYHCPQKFFYQGDFVNFRNEYFWMEIPVEEE